MNQRKTGVGQLSLNRAGELSRSLLEMASLGPWAPGSREPAIGVLLENETFAEAGGQPEEFTA